MLVFVWFQEKSEYFQHLNQEVSALILQLQTNQNSQLTVADVEAIVYRILGKETETLKASFEGAMTDDQSSQVCANQMCNGKKNIWKVPLKSC